MSGAAPRSQLGDDVGTERHPSFDGRVIRQLSTQLRRRLMHFYRIHPSQWRRRRRPLR